MGILLEFFETSLNPILDHIAYLHKAKVQDNVLYPLLGVNVAETMMPNAAQMKNSQYWQVVTYLFEIWSSLNVFLFLSS